MAARGPRSHKKELDKLLARSSQVLAAIEKIDNLRREDEALAEG